MIEPDGRARLTRYREILPLKDDGTVQLVRDDLTGTLFVKKTLSVCRRDVLQSLRAQPAPGMPRIREVADMGDVTVLVEDFVNGRTLGNLLESARVLEERQALTVFRAVAEAVKALHDRTPAVIHRDIKPENVLLAEDGRVFLLDVDAAKPAEPGLRRDTVLIGTVGYAAPEQYGFGGSDRQTDIYALGVLLNVMLTGFLPGERQAPGKSGAVIARATRMDPTQRYATVDELLTDLFGRQPEEKPTGRRRFLPPGMRGGDPVKTVLSAVGYALLIWLSCSIDYTNAYGRLDLIVNRVGFFVSVMLGILFFGNYLDIQTKLGLTKMQSKARRTAATVTLGIVLILLPPLLIAIGETLLRGDLTE